MRLTKDGKLAVIHDNTLDRTTGRSGRVADYTLKEITSINVIDGGKIPSLEMLIKLVAGFNKKLIIESSYHKKLAWLAFIIVHLIIFIGEQV